MSVGRKYDEALDRIAMNLSLHLGHLSTLADTPRKSDLYQAILKTIPQKERELYIQGAEENTVRP
jgi:hypothetical protein